jgi:hypothetical protein
LGDVILSKETEALLNEARGNLFEYAVAKEFAVSYGCLTSFIQGLNSRKQILLSQHEALLRTYDIKWLSLLQDYACQLVHDFSKKKIIKDVRDIQLLGKQSQNKKFGEADLLLQTGASFVSHPLSLKLLKKSAALNSKSAGIRSFLSDYVKTERGVVAQEQLNHFVDFSFEEFKNNLFASYGLSPFADWQEWNQKVHIRLPGELKDEGQKCLYDFYALLSERIHIHLSDIARTHPEVLKQALLEWMGFSHIDLMILIGFYTETSFQTCLLEVKQAQEELASFSIEKPENTSYLIFHLKTWQLILRVKPMNSFQVPSYKINFSLKLP